MRSRNLDVLRAIAILLVLGQHYQIQRFWSQIGWFGVELFFVLSGYLIGGLLFSEYKAHGKVRIVNFYVRRGLKIYPPFYLMIACTVLWHIFMGGDLAFRNVAAEVLFVQNYVYGLHWHTWSLAVEEHFYLILPLLLSYLIWKGRLAPGNPFRILPRVFVIVASLMLIGRIAVFLFASPSSYVLAYRATHLRLDALLFGVTLAYHAYFEREKLARLAKPWLLIVASVLCIATSMIFVASGAVALTGTVGLILLYTGFGAVVLLAVADDGREMNYFMTKVADGLAGIGAASYSVYLWHMPMKDWGLRVARFAVKRAQSAELSAVYARWEWCFYIAGSIALGLIMARMVEAPVLKLRDRFFPSRSRHARGVDEQRLGDSMPPAASALRTGVVQL